ncbi:MAG: transcriptional activator of cad operon [Francisellaceae bacterium]|jgi:transcriptional activator of cad operon
MTDITYKINDIIFSEVKQTLSFEKHTIELEVRESGVLAYFCKHANQQITRNELIDNVWHGQIITDNAVNRVITKLRKALGDDAKNSKFIQTLPRIGYKFIANTSLVEPRKLESAELSKPSYQWKVATLFLLIAATYLVLVSNTPEIKPLKTVSALTRDAGLESDAVISPNGKFLSYSSRNKRWKKLVIKNTATGAISQVSDNAGDASSATWSTDSTNLIYMYNNRSVCQIKRVFLLDNAISREEVIHNCPIGSYGRVAYNHNDSKIVYSERRTPEQPYLLYSLDIQSGYKQKLNQPSPFNAGHIFFDLHPSEDKLLLSTPDEQQWHAFYLLDLKESTSTYLFKKDEYICCAILNHAGNKIVVMGPYPNQSLVEMDFTGNNTTKIINSTHLISRVSRINNSTDYIYSGSQLNFDISFYDEKLKTSVAIIDSSVVDRLPDISNDNEQLAYISREANTAQVWLYNVNNHSRSQISQFTGHQHYQDLLFSPDNSKLSLLMSYGIKLLNISTRETQLVKIPLQVARGMSWFDETTLAFSLKVEGKWQVHHYSIITKKITLIDEDWAYIKYSKNPKETAFISQNNDLYINENRINLAKFNMIDYNRIFNFQVKDEHLYYLDNSSNSLNVIKMNLTNQQQESLLENVSPTKLTIVENGVYYTHMKSHSSDIFRTRNQD